MSEEDQIDAIIEIYEKWLWAENEVSINESLAEGDVHVLPPSVSLTMLSMTFVWKDRLIERPRFYNRLRKRLLAEYSIEDTENMLQDLC